jgi:hypothetical protein
MISSSGSLPFPNRPVFAKLNKKDEQALLDDDCDPADPSRPAPILIPY